MKILMFTPSYKPNVGGVEKHVEKISNELTMEGHEVTVVTRSPKNKDRDDLGEEVLTCGSGLIGSINWYRKFRRLITGSDIIHFHDHSVFIQFLFIRVLHPRKRFFITFHGHEGRFPIPLVYIVSRRICSILSHGNICVGEYIEKWYGTKADVITYGGCSRSSHGENDQDAVFIGRLAEDTGVRRYVEALGLLQARHPFTLDVIGDGPIQSELMDYANKRGLEIRFLGSLQDAEQMLGRYKFSFCSGYLGMLESLSNGCLIVTVYENELKRDYLKCFPGGGSCFPVCSTAEEISDAVVWLNQNRQAQEDARICGEEIARNNTWQKVRDDYYTLWGVK